MALNKGPFKITLAKVMSQPLITINKDSTPNHAFTIMRNKNITRLPVVSEAGDVLAVLSLKSLIRSLPSQDLHDAVGA
jgi:CBS domain-containing protein